MRPTTPRIVYLLLFLYLGISLGYQIAGSVSLVTGYFDLRHQVQEPFAMDFYDFTVTSVTKTAQKAGLAPGDTVESLNGTPYTGRAQWQAARWYAHSGELLRVGVRKSDGTHATVAIPLEGFPQGVSIGESIFVVVLHILVPLFCLIIGYWVALARPTDPNAWFILILLSFPESFISVSVFNWWPGVWLVLRLAWHIILLILAPAALLWLGLLFPERSRIDVRLPWLKWLVLTFQMGGVAVSLVTDYSVWYAPTLIGNRAVIDAINDRAMNWLMVLCLALYWVAIFTKLHTASTADARRRLRVLCAGSVVGLGSVLIIWGVLPWVGINPGAIQWLGYLSAVLMLAFPLSLAYVVIVQRALDVRMLMRMGTRYALARTTMAVVQIGAATFVVMRFVVPILKRKPSQAVDVIVPVVAIAVLVRLLLIRRSFGDRWREWLDRKFFREAHDAELILSELADRVRSITDASMLIDTISRRISEVFHIPQIAVLLRSGQTFRLQHAVGLSLDRAILLPESSAPVQHLVGTNAPAVLYRDEPDEWFLKSERNEQRALDDMQTEVLLPLPGRSKLMGVVALGPKRSEEPYSPSDLRLLASVGAQAGLGLEVSDLAFSLAAEASQRQRMEREIEIAREVQERLFPQQIPAIAGVDLDGCCRPALGVGGDYYDMFQLDDGCLALAIGDVSGKGISASLLMASLRASLRGITDDGSGDLARMMRKLNRLVYEASAANRYATFFFAVYAPATRELRYVNAGHNPPFLIRSGAEGQRLEASGPVIGLLRDVAYTEAVLQLARGDLLLTYTDGVSEAMTVADEEWGEERMLAAAQDARGLAATEILRKVMEAADKFTAGALQHDDMTLLVLRVN